MLRQSLYITVILSLLTSSSFATLKTYVGGSGTGLWSTSGNWSPAGMPLSFDDVSIVPSDGISRTVVYDTGQFLIPYGSIVVAPTAAFGTATLYNDQSFLDAGALSIGTRGAYTQRNVAGFVGSTLLNGGTITLFDCTFTTSTSLTLLSGTINLRGAHVITNGTFNANGGIVVNPTFQPQDGSLTNNGTLRVNAFTKLQTDVHNFGTIELNASIQIDTLTNYSSLTVPQDRALSIVNPFGVLRHRAGTLTALGSVSGSQAVIGGGTFMQAGTASFGGVRVGDVNAAGTFLQSAGFMDSSFVLIGGSLGSRGYHAVSGGTLSIGPMTIGTVNAISAVFEQSGGLVRIFPPSATTDDPVSLAIDTHASGTDSRLLISGGTFELRNSSNRAPPIAVNNGTIAQSGGTSIFPDEIVGVGRMLLSGNASLTVGTTTAVDDPAAWSNAGRIRQDRIELADNARIAQLHPANVPAVPASRVRSLSFDETGGTVHGTWDVAGESLVIDYTGNSPLTDIRRYLRSGHSGGSWNGTGLISSLAATYNPRNVGLGYAEASAILGPGGGIFAGTSVDGSAVLIKYTWYGDADLNGAVNFDDYARIDAGFNTGGDTWFEGDFNYDGVVNFDDYALIDLAFNTQGGVLRTVVPEPTSTTICLIAFSIFARRQMRRAICR